MKFTKEMGNFKYCATILLTLSQISVNARYTRKLLPLVSRNLLISKHGIDFGRAARPLVDDSKDGCWLAETKNLNKVVWYKCFGLEIWCSCRLSNSLKVFEVSFHWGYMASLKWACRPVCCGYFSRFSFHRNNNTEREGAYIWAHTQHIEKMKIKRGHWEECCTRVAHM